jgi:peptidoglycan/xylan/chitin deacetylase (PgdA/CDA1 family)
MPIAMPKGKTLAVSLSPDFDAQSVWMGTFRTTSQSALSRGEFGAEVGAPRLLELFGRYGITTTWCVPTHTMLTFPASFHQVVENGHEIAAHGVYHEFVPKLERDEERRLLELQIAQHESIVGKRPRGYRSPALDHTESTLDLLDEFEFDWESSLMGRDFTPYHPRSVTSLNNEDGNIFSEPARLLEFPVSWSLDDFPELELLKGNATQQSNDVVLKRWTDSFDFAHTRCPNGVLTITLHPQTIGRAHNMMMLERFLEHVTRHDDVWFPTLSQAFDAWTD